MEYDDIGLDAELAQRRDLIFEVTKHDRVRPIEILLAILSKQEGAMERLVFVIDVVLGKYAHADLVESRLGERLQGLRLQFWRLMRPGVACRAEWKIGRSVFIGEMKAISYAHRTVMSGTRRRAREVPALAVEIARVR